MTLALTFPGQGSQSVGMLGDLAAVEPCVEETFRRASDVLGYDLWSLVQTGTDAELAATVVTQPAMLTAGVAVWRIWQDKGGPRPDWVMGHSLGEFSALVAADALAFEAAVALVSDRAKFMQQAVPQGEGGIAALLGLTNDAVESVCAASSQGLEDAVWAVNYNAPGQVVIAGRSGAVDRAIDAAKEAGAKRAMRLPMSVPVHCPLMGPAAERFTESLAKTSFKAPMIPVLHNASIAPATTEEDIRRTLVRQLTEPVRWADSVRVLAENGVSILVEPGPGRVLTGLAKRIDRQLTAHAIHDPASLERVREQIEATL